MEPILLALITLVTLVVFFVWELCFPVRNYEKKVKVKSYVTNTGVFVVNNVLMYLLGVTIVFVLASTLSIHNSFTILPLTLQYVLGIIILDFWLWLWHVMSHKVPFLWAFHQTHHSEKYLNSTSAFRFHIGELLLSAAFKTIALVIFGIPIMIFFVYQSLITIFSIFNHANISLPVRIQSIMERIIISPRLHQTHHSTNRKQHDSNYGVIFSWWDIIFRTKNNQSPKDIGLPYGGEKNIWSFLTMPIVDRK